MKNSLVRRSLATVLTVAALLGLGGCLSSGDDDGDMIRIQSYNIFLGADLTPLYNAGNMIEAEAAGREIWDNVVRHKPEERMAAIARIIAAKKPALIGLQEVSRWYTAPRQAGSVPLVGGAWVPTYDYVELLVKELKAQGLSYRVAAETVGFDSGPQLGTICIPVTEALCGRYVDSSVILVDDNDKRLVVSNPRGAQYASLFSVKLLGILPISTPRQWSAVDVSVSGRTFSMFNTHFESFGGTPLKDEIRNEQARELVAVLGRSSLPSVLTGDINSRPPRCATARLPTPQSKDQNTVAWGLLEAAGLAESWAGAYPNDPCSSKGWTSGQNDMFSATSSIDHRIDVVMYSRPFSAISAEVLGDEPHERSPSGLWPSDHASSIADLFLPR